MVKYLLMAVLFTISCVSSERKEARVLYEKASQENNDDKRKIYYKEILDKYPATEYAKGYMMRDLLNQGNFDEVEKLSNALIKEYPDFEAGYYGLGVVKSNNKLVAKLNVSSSVSRELQVLKAFILLALLDYRSN